MNCEVSSTAGEEDDEDADDHFCLKCKVVVRGLENYVQHRKLGCRTAPAQVSVSYRVLPSVTHYGAICKILLDHMILDINYQFCCEKSHSQALKQLRNLD